MTFVRDSRADLFCICFSLRFLCALSVSALKGISRVVRPLTGQLAQIRQPNLRHTLLRYGGTMRLITLLAFASVLAGADTNADLLSAARAGDLAAVKTAVEGGAVLETKTPYGQTPLYLAAMNGHEEVVRFLLDKGAHTDVSDTFYKAPMLGFVIQRKHWGVAKMLVAKPSNPDQTLGEVA